MGDNVSYHSFSLASNLGGSKNSPAASCYENRLLIRRRMDHLAQCRLCLSGFTDPGGVVFVFLSVSLPV